MNNEPRTAATTFGLPFALVEVTSVTKIFQEMHGIAGKKLDQVRSQSSILVCKSGSFLSQCDVCKSGHDSVSNSLNSEFGLEPCPIVGRFGLESFFAVNTDAGVTQDARPSQYHQ